MPVSGGVGPLTMAALKALIARRGLRIGGRGRWRQRSRLGDDRHLLVEHRFSRIIGLQRGGQRAPVREAAVDVARGDSTGQLTLLVG